MKSSYSSNMNINRINMSIILKSMVNMLNTGPTSKSSSYKTTESFGRTILNCLWGRYLSWKNHFTMKLVGGLSSAPRRELIQTRLQISWTLNLIRTFINQRSLIIQGSYTKVARQVSSTKMMTREKTICFSILKAKAALPSTEQTTNNLS